MLLVLESPQNVLNRLIPFLPSLWQSLLPKPRDLWFLPLCLLPSKFRVLRTGEPPLFCLHRMLYYVLHLVLLGSDLYRPLPGQFLIIQPHLWLLVILLILILWKTRCR